MSYCFRNHPYLIKRSQIKSSVDFHALPDDTSSSTDMRDLDTPKRDPWSGDPWANDYSKSNKSWGSDEGFGSSSGFNNGKSNDPWANNFSKRKESWNDDPWKSNDPWGSGLAINNAFNNGFGSNSSSNSFVGRYSPSQKNPYNPRLNRFDSRYSTTVPTYRPRGSRATRRPFGRGRGRGRGFYSSCPPPVYTSTPDPSKMTSTEGIVEFCFNTL